MGRLRLPAVWLAALLLVLPAPAAKSDRTIVTLTTIEMPAIAAEGLDYAAVRVEVAHPPVEIGDPEPRQTKSICVPKGSKNVLKDAVEMPTSYYEVPYRTGDGVMVVRDGEGRVLWAERLDGLSSTEKFGYDQCRYWLPGPLEQDYAGQRAAFAGRVRAAVGEYFTRHAERVLERALFYRVVEENYPIYTFHDENHDYAVLDEAAGLADTGYRALRSAPGEPATLRQAIAIWEQALEQADLGDNKSRINRKVAVKLHVNIGAALLAMGDAGAAVRHLEQATRLGMAVSNSKGVGSGDLLERARERKLRASRNPGSGNSRPADLDERVARTNAYRGTIPVVALPASQLARLESAHADFAGNLIVETAEAEAAERDAAIASGADNPYERMVTRTSVQGFVLFLMPFPRRLDSFPVEVCELRHLNQLRVAGHGYETVPEQIGELRDLKMLDLSGNRIQSIPASIRFLDRLAKLDLSNNRITALPEEIGDLKDLKTLNLKGNPLEPGEAERLRQLLPDCKIKL